ncbi:SulP family inorganic anion transporter [Caulobacter sp.]|uniref:SulP family inorganic anion transporter n=1 Tax=Caulobacter sp. TaxID=78 RepID=UPI002B4A18B0|nr:SulP family inorganic anion transporter [Caulobacter sp.]HJV41005.1 SulP family inorganic anion transporter [Caulobacter sp.]
MGLNWRLFEPKTVTVLRQGYAAADFRADLIAGLTVAIVALPLSMALAIASGTTPDRGLVTAVVAGFLISLLGGSRFQIGGPTGAFVVVVYGVIAKHGYDGLLMATLMAGGILILAGISGLGTFIKYIPDPVTTGFTAGIAVIIFTSQIKDFLGLTAENLPADFLPKLAALWDARASLSPSTVVLALACLALILALRRWAPKAPGFLVATIAGAAFVAVAHPPIETIGSRFGGVPSSLPAPSLAFWSLAKAQAVAPSAFTIALLAGVESLLSAVVADQMTGRRHRSGAELIAQGVANIASTLFGGMPATGAIARTATSIRAGARSPVAGMAHAVFLLLFMLLAAPLMRFVPLAALAATLMIVAFNMAELHRFAALLRASNGERAILLATFGLTVLVDLTLAIEVGMVLAAFVFMHRMAQLAEVKHGEGPIALDGLEGDSREPYAPNFGLPDDVAVITFRGALFFGSASLVKDALEDVAGRKRCYILRLEDTPMVDPTGAFALADLLRRTLADGEVILCGASRQVLRDLLRTIGAPLLRRARLAVDFDTAKRMAMAGEIGRT